MTKRELIEKLAEFPDDALILRGDSDWGETAINKVEIITAHKRYEHLPYEEHGNTTECWDVTHCLCQDAEEPTYGTRRECVKIS